MKVIAGGLLLAVIAFAQAPLPATDVTAAEIQAFLKSLPRDTVTDKAIKTVDVGGYRVGVFGVFRPKAQPGDANRHETKVTEIYYILDGGGVLVTGGKMVNEHKRETTIGHVSYQAPTIDGGVTRHVGKGDVIIIPGNTPHWFKSLDADTTYLIYRPDPEGTLPLTK